MTGDETDFLVGPGIGQPLALFAGTPVLVGMDIASDDLDIVVFCRALGHELQTWQIAVLQALSDRDASSVIVRTDAQYLKTRKQNVEDICRFFGVAENLFQPTPAPDIQEIREIKPARFERDAQPWRTPNRRKFKRSQKRI